MAARWDLVVNLLLLLPLLPSASSMVLKLDGNVYPTGHFYVTMHIGVPAKPYFLDIDTGSKVTWLECDAGGGSCQTCNKTPHPLYRPKRINRVPCAHPLCDALHRDLGTQKNCTEYPQQCDYGIKYLDGSWSTGVLLQDKFSFSESQIAFGCGYEQGDNPGKEVPVDGILGLGKGSVDLVSQLKNHHIITKNVVGHCLSSKGGGYLLIGQDHLPSSQLNWVPMAPKTPRIQDYYSPGRATLNLGTTSIGAKAEVVLDSGSTYTYLPNQLHLQLVSVLKASLSKSLIEVPGPNHELRLCWKGPQKFKFWKDLKKEFKLAMSLKFDNGPSMMIPPKNYLIITGDGNACLGVLGMQGLDTYLIGDVTLQDQLVIYDNETGHLAWEPSLCEKAPKV